MKPRVPPSFPELEQKVRENNNKPWTFDEVLFDINNPSFFLAFRCAAKKPARKYVGLK